MAVALSCIADSAASHTPEVAPAPRPAKSTRAACLMLAYQNHRCSATVIATAGDLSLAVCNNHCFAEQAFPGAPFPRAAYPLACRVQHLETGVWYDATAIDGATQPDVSLLVVNGRLATATCDLTEVPRGTRCEHFGITSRHATGVVLVYDTSATQYPNASFRSTCSSIPGDSGAGVFVGGKLVAVNWGRWIGPNEQAGSTVRHLSNLVSGSGLLARMHPDLWRSGCNGLGLPGLPLPPVVKPPDRIPEHPPVLRPQPPGRSPAFPRLRRLIGR